MTKAYDADNDPEWLVYLVRNGSLSWMPGHPRYESLMHTWQKEKGKKVERKKNDRGRAASKKRVAEERRGEVQRGLVSHPL